MLLSSDRGEMVGDDVMEERVGEAGTGLLVECCVGEEESAEVEQMLTLVSVDFENMM